MPEGISRTPPARWQSVWILARADLVALSRSWLCRGFLLVSVLLTLLELKGMQAEEAPAARMLEVVYTTYLLIWMHAVIFIAGGALTREQDCLGEAILSRGVTRGEYIGGKLVARTAALLIMVAGVLLPAGFWAIRQDELVRTDDGFVATHSRDTEVEAWKPRKLFAGASGTVGDRTVDPSDRVHVGDVLLQLDDSELFSALETERRALEDALSQVDDTRRRQEEAIRASEEAKDALGRAERALRGAHLLSKVEQADREADVRARQRELEDSANLIAKEKEAIARADHSVENARARVREARIRLAHATVTSPISGHVIESNIETGQHVNRGEHLFTIAPMHEYRLHVPVPDFDEFQRLEEGLTALVKIQDTEFTGSVDQLGATTRADRWGNQTNFAVVRFRSDDTIGLLGRSADVRIVLPPEKGDPSMADELLNTITGHGEDDVDTRTASVTQGWMFIGLAKVIGCVCLLIALAVLAAVLTRNSLIAILGVIGLWHISNLIFDFVGLPELSYLEIVRTLDKVLAGVADTGDELMSIGWLFGLAIAIGAAAVGAFIARDPVK